MKNIWRATRGSGAQNMRMLILYLLAAAVVVVCEILVTRLTGSIGQAAVSLDVEQILAFLLSMALITGVKIIGSASMKRTLTRQTGKVAYAFRRRFAGRVASIPYGELAKRGSGEMLSLFAKDVEDAADLATASVYAFCADVVTLAASVVFLMTIHPWITLMFFAMFPPLAWMQGKISKPIEAQMIKASTYRGALNAVINDSLQNPYTVAAYSLEDAMETRYMEQYRAYIDITIKRVKSSLRLVCSGIIATMLPLVFINIAAGAAVARGAMSIGEFIAYTTVVGTAGSWLSMLSQRLTDIRSKSAGAIRVADDVLVEAEEPPALKQNDALPPQAGMGMRFDRVSFSYDGQHQALRHLSFTLRAGERTAIVGPSGCGKSTVMKLILGLYEPDEGVIALSGEDTRAMTDSRRRALLAYVPQDSFLFPGTIRENITGFASSDETDAERFSRACEDAGVHPFACALPEGYDTLLAEAADNLSGGQRQRVAIARALYRNAPILLFDEATSALDAQTEAQVLRAFYASTRGKTAVIVAHRLAAVRDCDHILVMDQGEIVESGTYEALMSAGGVFAKLYSDQEKEKTQ